MVVYKAAINSEHGYVQSKEPVDLYGTFEP